MQAEKLTVVYLILLYAMLISGAPGCASSGNDTSSDSGSLFDTSSDTSSGTSLDTSFDSATSSETLVFDSGLHPTDSATYQWDSDTFGDTVVLCASGQKSCDDSGTMVRLCLDGIWTDWDDCEFKGEICSVTQGVYQCVVAQNADTGSDSSTSGSLDSSSVSDTAGDLVTGTDTHTDADTGIATDTLDTMDSETEPDSTATSDTGTATDSGADTDTEALPDTAADTGTISDTATATDTGTDTGTISDTDTATDTGTDTGTSTDTGTGTGTEGLDSDTNPVTGQFTVTTSTSSAIPTVGIVEWAIHDVTVDSAIIEFGLDTSYGTEAPVDLNALDYRTLLLGLKANTNYHFRIVVQSSTGTWISENYTLLSGDTMNVVPPEITISQPSKTANGFIVTSYYNSGVVSSMGPAALVFDSDGDLVWWHLSSLPDATRARMSFEGEWMVLIPSNNAGNSGSIEMVSMDGETETSFAIPGAAHDITPLPDNTFAYLEYTDAGGMLSNACAKIMALDEAGNTTLIYDSADLWTDNCHGAALRYSIDEDLFTISDHFHGQIAAVSRNGTFQWATSHSGLFEFVYGHQLLDGNQLLVFDNGGPFSSGTVVSQALSLTVDNSGSLLEEWSYSADDLGSPIFGDVQRLPNGNTLVSYSSAAIIHEVDADQQLVREWDFGNLQFGYVVWRPTLYGPPIDLEM